MVPILPGTKRPAWNDWPRKATADWAEVDAWWTANPEHGVGIATGPESGIWVMDIDPRNGGDETLHELEQQHGPLEGHYEVLTGGGGRHFYFTLVGEADVHAGVLGPGIDIKSRGGQVLAPPTVHPDTGRRYVLELEGAATPRPAPEWLMALVTAPARAHEKSEPVPRETLLQSDFAWDRYNGSASNQLTADLMVELGWSIISTTRNGVISLQRPDVYEGEGKEGVSATVGAISGAPGVLYCWTSSVPGFEPERPYDAAQILAKARYGGEEGDTDQALSDAGWGLRSRWVDATAELATYIREQALAHPYLAPDEEDPWADADIARILNEPPVEPSLVPRTDGQMMLYPGSLHWLTAEPESGKTWLSIYMMKTMMEWGMHVTYIDYENGLPLLERCLLIGIPIERLTRQLHLKMMPPSWADNPQRIISDVQQTGSRAVFIDSASPCMASAGLDPIDNSDVLRFVDFARRLTIGGAAVQVLDHLRKEDNASQRYPLGAGQKFAQATVAFGMGKRSHFVPGGRGVADLYIHKDRHGQLRKTATTHGEHQMFGRFILDSNAMGECTARITPYDDEARVLETSFIRPLPYDVMQAVSDLLIDAAVPVRKSFLEVRIEATKPQIDLAVDELVRKGFVGEDAGDRGRILLESVRPYRARYDPDSPFYDPEP